MKSIISSGTSPSSDMTELDATAGKRDAILNARLDQANAPTRRGFMGEKRQTTASKTN